MKAHRIIFFLLLTFFIMGAVCASDLNSTDIANQDNVKEIYVSDTGDDSNTGSNLSPYASIGKAISNSSSSEDVTIYISQGTFGSDNDSNFDINLNHKIYGGSLTFIGEGKNKTFIDGQSAFKFANLNSNTNITLKNLSLINFKGQNGGTISSYGILTIDNCKIENSYSTSNRGGAIYVEGDEAVLNVKNSDFIKTSVNQYNPREFYVQGGGAIYASNVKELYLENNTFKNIRLSNVNLRGVAILSNSKTYLNCNKFINLTGTTLDASIFLNNPNLISTVINNQFINCSMESTQYSIVHLSHGNYTWKNNTFINSQNSIGNVYLSGIAYDTILEIPSEIKFNITSFNEGIVIPVNLKDDNGNIIKSERVELKYVGVNKTYKNTFFIDNNKITLTFDSVLPNGKYDVYYGENKVSVIDINLTDELVEVWVAPNGNDANSGTKNAPFKTIEYAIVKSLQYTVNVVVHLAKGTYADDGNLGFSLSNLGNVEIIGEEYSKTIIDAQNSNIFMNIDKLNLSIKNITFTNGYIKGGVLLSGVYLDNCIVTNSTAEYIYFSTGSAIAGYVLSNVKSDNLVYTNNKGVLYLSNNLSSGYFANNNNSANDYGFIYVSKDYIVIENCKFINNTARDGSVINLNYALRFTSLNNYYEGNYAINSGVFRLTAENHYFINDVYINNSAQDYAVFGVGSRNQVISIPEFYNCTFISNNAEKGVLGLKQGKLVDCSFKDDKCYEVVIVPIEITKNVDYDEITFENVEFNNTGIYLDADNLNEGFKYKLDLINLTIKFDDLNIKSYANTLTATVIGPCGSNVSGNNLDFIFNGKKIGSAPIVNSSSTLKYFGFVDGVYTLSGSTSSASSSSIIADGTIIVDLNSSSLCEVWVSENGNDENIGTSESPFKTISHAFDVASENSGNIVIYLKEGTYDSDLIISSNINVKIIGQGEKTVLDGKNANKIIKITEGRNQVMFNNLTIQNINPNNSKSGIINSLSPIFIGNSNVVFDNVKFIENHGGNAIIENNGNLTIKNSEFKYNGYSSKGIISGGYVVINNTLMTANFGQYSMIDVKALDMENCEIKDNFILNTGYLFITATQSINALNCKIYNSGNASEDILSIGGYGGNLLIPFLSLMATDISVSNITMENNIDYGADEAAFIAFGARGGPNMDTAHKSPVNVYAVNSTFSNFQMIWMTNVFENATRIFDNCIFENFSAIARSLTEGENPTYNISNSIFISDEFVIDQIGFRTYDFPNGLDLNYNWWGSNDKPVIVDIQNDGQHMDKTFSPNNWLVLVQENGLYKFKLSDGKQLLDYDGNLPVGIVYVKDETNNIISVLNIGGESYKFTSDGDDVVVDWSNPIAEVVPLKTVNITVFAQDVNLIYGDSSKFVANFTDIWGDALFNVNVTFSIGGDLIKATTDENGTAYFNIDLALGSYIVEVINPVTSQSIFRTVNVTTDKSIVAGDVSAVYGDKSVFSAVFTDEFGYPLINTVVSFNIGGDIVNVTTDENGCAVFAINFNAGSYNITSVNPVTGKTVSNSVVVSKVATKITAPKVSMVYNDGKYLTVTLKDASGNYLVKSDVTIKVGSNVYNRVADSKGQVKLLINLAPNTYSTTVSYSGGNNYISSSLKTSVIVKKATPKIAAAKKTFKKSVRTKKYTITLKNNKNKVMKNTKVYIKVNGKTYAAKTNGKGKATFKITKLTKKGTFKATITYKGSKYFNKVTKKVNIKIK